MDMDWVSEIGILRPDDITAFLPVPASSTLKNPHKWQKMKKKAYSTCVFTHIIAQGHFAKPEARLLKTWSTPSLISTPGFLLGGSKGKKNQTNLSFESQVDITLKSRLSVKSNHGISSFSGSIS